MMGIYPVSPATPVYTISTPRFTSMTIHLDTTYYKNKKLVIKRTGDLDGKIKSIKLNNKVVQGYFINHQDLLNGAVLEIKMN